MSEAWNQVPSDLREIRRRTLYEVFTPAAPVDRREVFSGRSDQLAALQEVMWQKGQHAVIYGERGVGKTSLAKVAREIAANEEKFQAHVTCDSADTFDSLWRKILAEIAIEEGGEVSSALDRAPLTAMGPNEVRVVLSALTAATPAVLFIDEFDVILDQDTRRAMAETVKVLSDQGVNATLVLVGVAESVTDLIDAHESTERNIIQVPMPRMSPQERRQIIDRGLEIAEMTIADDAATRITTLSQGLAQFVHLLAQRSGLVCIDKGRDEVATEDVTDAIDIALRDTHASVTNAYYKAATSNQQTLYPSVLLACALAQPDERGFFSAKSLVEPISEIAGKRLEIPAFGPHLDKLATERGPVLFKAGEKRKFRYRFKNPLMQPYVLMRGVKDGMITFDAITKWIAPDTGGRGPI